MSASRVFTIPPGAPFLPTLAEALLSGRLVGDVGSDPFALGAVTLYLPTRRAARAFSATLAQRLGGAALMPRMIPLGEANEAEFDLAASPLLETGADVLHPPIPPLERRLVLARLVLRWAREVDRRLLPIDDDVPFTVPSSPSDAVGLAGDLERLMDALTVEGLPWTEIGAAVEAEYSRYFGLTLDFLKIAAENWPKILAARGLSDPVARSRALLLAAAERLHREPPEGPVIVAGSTGSVPATAQLIAAIAALPRGAVVLPGLDQDLDEAGWAAIDDRDDAHHGKAHGHPQAILHRLLGSRGLRLGREAVAVLGEPAPTALARAAMLSQALRPAETTDAWAAIAPQTRKTIADAGLSGLAVVETADEREEALVIAIALREALERDGATAALVTPDRGLALRVSAELARWGIAAEDSAGTSLAQSAAGRFARLAAELATDVAPARVIGLLAHPLVRLGLSRSDVVRGAAALEIGVLRGPAPKPGFAGMLASLDERRLETRRVPRARQRLASIDWDLAAEILQKLRAAYEGFACESADEDCDLVALAARHRKTCEALLAGEEAPVAEDDSIETLDALFDDLEQAADDPLPGRFGDYPALYTAFARERVVACGAPGAHPRVRILGLLEARLLDFDRIVLGGLDEGVWPARQQTDAFLNRPMRERIGLDPPERRIGQSAHDFVQALGCGDAVITRAAKRDSAPTVRSRFLQRLKAFVGEEPWSQALAAGERLRGFAAALDRGFEPAPLRLTQPKPRPDPALFPNRLSVTEIETLVRDPYAIFARHVLGLEPLDAVAVTPGAGDRGTIVHDILGKFADAYPAAIADWGLAEERLAQLAATAFAPIEDTYPEIYAEWFPRYQRMAEAFLAWEVARRPDTIRVHAEIKGEMPLAIGARSITISGIADRIEARHGGGHTIVDYKTGTPPTNKVVFAGFSPQLTLEAAMLRAGAFKGLKAETVPDLLYVHASGGREPFRSILVAPPKEDTRTVDELVNEHLKRLQGLLRRFLDGEAAYVSRPYPQYANRFSAYDHLARVLEWSLVETGDGP